MLRPIRWLPVAVLGTLLGSCASVEVQKIPTPTQYVEWDDKKQAEADAIEGFRFYLPRPFVNVFESFPVHAEVYIADGMVSPDGQYVIIRRVRSDSGLSDIFAGELANVPIPKSVIRAAENGENLQSGTEAAAAATAAAEETKKTLEDRIAELEAKLDGTIPVGAASGEDETEKDDSSEAVDEPVTPPPPATGQERRSVTNRNGAFAYQPMRGNMDIVYLPDFEEQYAVGSEANLGNVDFGLNLGQGWSLQGFNSLVDNSQLTKRVFDLIDLGIDTARSVAPSVTTKLQGLLGAVTAGQEIALQSGETEQPNLLAGANVSLKITVVYYAAKGLYPIIKPRELQERIGLTSDGVAIDLTGEQVKPIVSTHYDPRALKRAQDGSRDVRIGSYTVPRYPYQYISFNTFKVLAVEAINPTTDPFLYLTDKTGTRGDPGDRQAADLRDNLISQDPPAAPTPPDSGTGRLPSELTQLQSGLEQAGDEGLRVTVNGQTFQITSSGSSMADPTKLVLTASSDQCVDVTAIGPQVLQQVLQVLGLPPAVAGKIDFPSDIDLLAAPTGGMDVSSFSVDLQKFARALECAGETSFTLDDGTELTAKALGPDATRLRVEVAGIPSEDLQQRTAEVLRELVREVGPDLVLAADNDLVLVPGEDTPPPPAPPAAAPAAWQALDESSRKQIQILVCEASDGDWGPRTRKAIAKLAGEIGVEPGPDGLSEVALGAILARDPNTLLQRCVTGEPISPPPTEEPVAPNAEGADAPPAIEPAPVPGVEAIPLPQPPGPQPAAPTTEQ